MLRNPTRIYVSGLLLLIGGLTGLIILLFWIKNGLLALLVFIVGSLILSGFLFVLHNSFRSLNELNKINEKLSDELELTNDQLKNLTANSSSVILVVDASGTIVYCSPSIKNFGGYDLREETGQKISKYFLNNRDKLEQTFTDLYQREDVRKLEFRFKQKNRKPFPAEMEIISLRSKDKKRQFYCTIRNITRLKRSEMLLDLQGKISKIFSVKTTLRKKFLSILKALCSLEDIDCGLIYVTGTSSRACNLIAHTNLSMGFTQNFSFIAPNSYVHKLISEKSFTHLPFERFIKEFSSKEIATGGTEEISKEKLQYITFFPALQHGELYGLLAVGSHDFAEMTPEHIPMLENLAFQIASLISKSRTDVIVEESIKRHKTIFEKSHEAIVLMDERGIIIEANESAGKLFGAKHNKSLLGKSLVRVSPPTQAGSIMSEVFFSELIKGAVVYGFKKFECTLETLAKKPFEAELRLNSFYIRKGKIIQASIRDVTILRKEELERDILRKQLMQAQKLESIGRLASGIAHDFNNLLAPIMGFSEMALSKIPAEDELHEDISSILQASNRAKHLTRQLLVFSRKEEIQQRVESLDSIVENFEKIIKRTLREDIDVLISVDSDQANIWADSSQIEQIIMNLVVNAQDAMPNGGKLSIKTYNRTVESKVALRYPNAKAGRYSVLEITDSGHGMDEETRTKIFEPFFTTKEAKQGTGLGLSTVYGIVENNGGFIEVKSKIEKGTTFALHFPIVQGEKNSDVSNEEKKAQLARGRESVLLVEDHDLTRKFVEKMLSNLGYRIISVSNPGDAISIFNEETDNIDILVTDVIMPGMNGKSLFEELRKKAQMLKVLYISGYTGSAVLDLGISSKYSAFLQKPFTQSQLSSKIYEILNARE